MVELPDLLHETKTGKSGLKRGTRADRSIHPAAFLREWFCDCAIEVRSEANATLKPTFRIACVGRLNPALSH